MFTKPSGNVASALNESASIGSLVLKTEWRKRGHEPRRHSIEERVLSANAVELVLATLFVTRLILGLTSRSLYGQNRIVSRLWEGQSPTTAGQRYLMPLLTSLTRSTVSP
jgi:hypothetical protein